MGWRGEWEAAPAPACSLCPSPVGRTTARGTPTRERVTQAACPIQPKGDGASSTASSPTFPGLHSASKAPVVPHSSLLACRVGPLTPLPRDFRGSLHCREQPRSSSALKGAVTLHPASPQAGSLSAPAPSRVPGAPLGALGSPLQGARFVCPTLLPALPGPSAPPLGSTLAAPPPGSLFVPFPLPASLAGLGVSLWRPQEVPGFLATAQSPVHHSWIVLA